MLVLFSNEFELPANQLVARGFRDEIAKSGGFRTFTEFLDLVRFPKQIEDRSLVSQLHEKYADQKIDVIVTIAEEASSFIMAERNQIAPDAPVVFAAVSERHPIVGVENTTGLISHYDILTTLKLAAGLQPDARDIFVITGAAAADREAEKRSREELPALGPDFRFHFLSGLPRDELMKEVSSFERDAIVFYFSMYEDANGVKFIPRDVARMISEASAAPVYGVYDSYLETGIVGGYFDRFESVGREAAKLALRVLNGENAASIRPYVADTHRFVVDGSVIESRSLDMNALPEGTVIQNWQPPLWRQYLWFLVAIAAAFAAETLLLLWLFLAVRRQHAAERTAAEHQRQMEVQRAELAHLTRVSALGQLSGAIAHELNQPLTAILANAQAAQDMLKGNAPDLPEVESALADIVTEDHRAGEVIKRLTGLLKKGRQKHEDVDANELIRSTLALLRSQLVAHQVETSVELAEALPVVRADPIQLQQVLINLVVNSIDAMGEVKPAVRRLVVRSNIVKPDSIEISVQDSGRGLKESTGPVFEPFYTTKPHGLGLGLSICSTIVGKHGGVLKLDNHAGGGVLASFTLPAAEVAIAAE